MTAPTTQPLLHHADARHTADARPADSRLAPSRHQQIVKQTQKWVAQSFYGTLLRQMRQDPFKSDLFDGGRGGQMFSELLDQHLSERMAGGAPNKLVNAIVKRIEHNRGLTATGKSSATTGKGATPAAKASASYLRQSRPPTPAEIAPQYQMNIEPAGEGQSHRYGGANVSSMD